MGIGKVGFGKVGIGKVRFGKVGHRSDEPTLFLKSNTTASSIKLLILGKWESAKWDSAKWESAKWDSAKWE